MKRPEEATEPASPNRRWMAATAEAAPPATPATSDAPVASVFDVPAERFVEIAELGRGGMGRVVEAHDRALDRRVAIKHSLATAVHDVARFEREARVTARLQHPSIVPIIDVGRDADGAPYYIMRRIDGEPLSARVIAAATLRDRIALVPALLGAIDAAAYAHAQRVIHRDIKPWNILLGPYGETLLIDWGIARELDTDDIASVDDAADTKQLLTRFGSAMGTPGFIAPEQARGDDIDARADVYSLGATLYFVLTGESPFAGVDATVAIARVAEGAGPDLSRIPAEAPAELTAIATKALARLPADRYADAGELAADLRRFQAGQLVAAHVYTSRERVARWVRRHRIAVAVGAIALAVIAAVSVVSVRRVIADRDRAREASRLAVERADEILVDRARSLLTTDPTSAVAALRGLRADSRLWPTATTVTRAAVGLGVERRVGLHPSFVTALRFSPDGSKLVSASKQILLHDLTANTTRVLASREAGELHWRDDRTVVYFRHASGSSPELGTIDVVTGTLTPIAEPDVADVEILGPSIIVRTSAGGVARYEPDGTRTEILKAGASTLAIRGARLVVFGREQFAVIDPDRTTTFATSSPGGSLATLSTNGKRVALLAPGGVVREWSTDTGELLGQWQRPVNALNEIGYVENLLYTWSNVGIGFMSLEAEPTPRWMTRERRAGVFVGKILPYQGGALLANDSGGLALADAYGVSPLAHRLLSTLRAAIDPRGARLAIGTSSGDVLVMELAAVRPAITPMAPNTEFEGVAGTRALFLTKYAEVEGEPYRNVGPDGNGVLVDLVTGTRTPVEKVEHIAGEVLIGPDGDGILLRDAATLVGRTRIAKPRMFRFDESNVFYVDQQGALWRQPVAPWGDAVKLGAIPPAVFGTTDTRFSRIDILGGVPVISLDVPEKAPRYFVPDAGQLRELALAMPAWTRLGGRTPDGTWFGVENYTTLWRAREGQPAEAVSLPREVTVVLVEGDQVRAFGSDTLMMLASDGRLVHEYNFGGTSTARAASEQAVAFGDVDGVIEVVPATNVRRVLRASGKAIAIRIPRGKRELFAVIETGTGERYLAHWVDPVPSDPRALATHLDTITNARLEQGSDAIAWQ